MTDLFNIGRILTLCRWMRLLAMQRFELSTLINNINLIKRKDPVLRSFEQTLNELTHVVLTISTQVKWLPREVKPYDIESCASCKIGSDTGCCCEKVVTKEEVERKRLEMMEQTCKSLITFFEFAEERLPNLETVEFDDSFDFSLLSSEDIAKIFSVLPKSVKHLFLSEHKISDDKEKVVAIFDSLNVAELHSLRLRNVYLFLMTIAKKLVEKGYNTTLKNLVLVINGLTSKSNPEQYTKYFLYLSDNFALKTLAIRENRPLVRNVPFLSILLPIVNAETFILSGCEYFADDIHFRINDLVEGMSKINPSIIRIDLSNNAARNIAVKNTVVSLLALKFLKEEMQVKQEIVFDLSNNGFEQTDPDLLKYLAYFLLKYSNLLELDSELLLKMLEKGIEFPQGTHVTIHKSDIKEGRLTEDEKKLLTKLPPEVIEAKFVNKSLNQFQSPFFSSKEPCRVSVCPITPLARTRELSSKGLFFITSHHYARRELYHLVASGFISKLTGDKLPITINSPVIETILAFLTCYDLVKLRTVCKPDPGCCTQLYASAENLVRVRKSIRNG